MRIVFDEKTKKTVMKPNKVGPMAIGRDKKSKMFSTEAELTPSVEQILAACPEEIPESVIDIENAVLDRTRREQIRKYEERSGRKYKWWSEDDRIRAATVYALVGSAVKVQEITGIPAGTIRQWKTTEWWPQIVDRIRRDQDDSLDVKLTGLIDKSVKEINDRLEKGDYVYNNTTGELSRKPVGGKDMAVMTSIFVDKRALLRKKQKAASDNASVDIRLKKLAEEFGKFVQAKTIESTAKEIDDAQQEVASPQAG